MKEIKLSQGKVALVDDEDFEYLNQFKWFAHKARGIYYADRHSPRSHYKRTFIRMHREILKLKDSRIMVDHINHNGLDNRRENLRSCTNQQNGMNRKSVKNSSSEFKGVSWHSVNKNWLVQIQKGKDKFYLGYFSSETDAARAYNKKAQELFGEFANLNNVVTQ